MSECHVPYTILVVVLALQELNHTLNAAHVGERKKCEATDADAAANATAATQNASVTQIPQQSQRVEREREAAEGRW
jgi:hypothetical protein